MKTTIALTRSLHIAGRSIEIDSEDYLVDRSQWSEDFARALARGEGLEITPEHWQVIHFLRDFYFEHGVQAQMRVMIRHLQ